MRRFLEVGPGDRLVLMVALWLGFISLLQHWHTPTWLFVPALVAGWFVLRRYRWITGGRARWNEGMRELEEVLHERGRPLRIDADAESDDQPPVFLARPAGAPVYHGFPILEDVEVAGFKLGMISDWEAEPMSCGDAFVVAPDDSRCGLVWEVTEEPYIQWPSDLDETRWGVWDVGFPHPMDSRENARRNLAHVLPPLRQAWENWRDNRPVEA